MPDAQGVGNNPASSRFPRTPMQSVNLCGKRLNGLRHICGFFDSRDEQYNILGPYLKEGIDNGERVVTILDSQIHDDHRARLETAGISVTSACEKDQLQIVASEDSYLKGGVFAVKEMYDMLAQVITDAENSEYKTLRTVGDMEWALKGCEGTEDLIEYEARVNQLAPKHDCTLLCAYDINQFSGRVIADVLATHSHVILGGQVHENPHFVDPVTFLQKMALRRPSSRLAPDS
jgi:hypothetical protein